MYFGKGEGQGVATAAAFARAEIGSVAGKDYVNKRKADKSRMGMT